MCDHTYNPPPPLSLLRARWWTGLPGLRIVNRADPVSCLFFGLQSLVSCVEEEDEAAGEQSEQSCHHQRRHCGTEMIRILFSPLHDKLTVLRVKCVKSQVSIYLLSLKRLLC